MKKARLLLPVLLLFVVPMTGQQEEHAPTLRLSAKLMLIFGASPKRHPISPSTRVVWTNFWTVFMR